MAKNISRELSSNKAITNRIKKGWQPHKYLTNLSMAYFAEPGDWVGTRIFPICPVTSSMSYFYTFAKGDLARDNVRRKPAYGKVDPATMAHNDDTYRCLVDQIIVGIDEIDALDYSRSGAPQSIDPRRNKARFIAEQMNLHLDIEFAKNYFSSGIWAQEYTGVTSSPSGSQFLKFNDANFDPVRFFNRLKREVKVEGRRTPNKLALGYDAYLGLIEHPDILERVKYSGSTANPAIVNKNVLAQILELQEIAVLESTYNRAEEGQPDEMDFICDSKGALLCYTTNTPQIDEPSAGYTFTWDMLGDGNWMATDEFEGDGGTHTTFMEGLMSKDMKKTSDDLAIFLNDCV